MDNLCIAGTSTTPSIVADVDGRLVMRGDSYPENSFELYQPVIDWVAAFLDDHSRALHVELHLLYLNTSSIRALMDILDMLETAHQQGRQVSLCWHYSRGNERVAELAEEFREDYTFPFDITGEGG